MKRPEGQEGGRSGASAGGHLGQVQRKETKRTFVWGDFVFVFGSARQLQEILDQVQRDERLTEHQPEDRRYTASLYQRHVPIRPAFTRCAQAHSHFVVHFLCHAEDFKEEHHLSRVLQDLGVGLGDKFPVPVSGGAAGRGASRRRC